MKKSNAMLYAALLSAISGHSLAQYAPQNITTINVRDVLSKPWNEIGTVGAQTYSYQLSHAIKYSAQQATPQNINVDVILKNSIIGSNGKISETDLDYIGIVCYSDHTFPSKFFLYGSKAFNTDDAGFPGAPIDDVFQFINTSASTITVQQGTVGAKLQKLVCGDRSLYSQIPAPSSRPFDAYLDGHLIDVKTGIVEGRTNLPDGTKIYVEFHKGNFNSNYYMSTFATALNGSYKSSALIKQYELNSNKPHGTYTLAIRTAPSTYQPPDVISIIGNGGSNLRGSQAHSGEVLYTTQVTFP